VVFSATSETTATLDIREFLLQDSVPMAPLIRRQDDVEVGADGRWVLTESTGDVSVYIAELDGDKLALNWDSSDVRNKRDTPPPEQILAERAKAWATTTADRWELQGGCVSNPVTTMSFDMVLTIAPRVSTRTMRVYFHSKSDCSDSPQPVIGTQEGMVEEEGATLRTWWPEAQVGAVTLTAMYEELSFTMAGDTLTLTPVECIGKPTCDFPLNGQWQRSP
jgi:hypothetical protein